MPSIFSARGCGDAIISYAKQSAAIGRVAMLVFFCARPWGCHYFCAQLWGCHKFLRAAVGMLVFLMRSKARLWGCHYFCAQLWGMTDRRTIFQSIGQVPMKTRNLPEGTLFFRKSEPSGRAPDNRGLRWNSHITTHTSYHYDICDAISQVIGVPQNHHQTHCCHHLVGPTIGVVYGRQSAH